MWRALYIGQTDNFAGCLSNHERWDEAQRLGASAYQSGQMSGGAYAASIGVGALTGGLSGLVPGLGGVLTGALMAGANDVANQTLTKPCKGIDWEHAGPTSAFGLGAGMLGMAGEAAGSQFFGPGLESVGKTLGGQAPTLGPAGGVVGNSAGSIISNWIYP